MSTMIDKIGVYTRSLVALAAASIFKNSMSKTSKKDSTNYYLTKGEWLSP